MQSVLCLVDLGHISCFALISLVSHSYPPFFIASSSLVTSKYTTQNTTKYINTQRREATHHPANRNGQHPPPSHRLSRSHSRIFRQGSGYATRCRCQRYDGSIAGGMSSFDFEVFEVGQFEVGEDGEAAYETVWEGKDGRILNEWLLVLLS